MSTTTTATGPTPTDTSTARQNRLIVAAIAVAGTVLSLLRIPGGTWDTFYAEDGQVFISAWLHDPGAHLLIKEYAGYQHALPRILSWLVVHLPIGWWAVATLIASCLAVGAVAALSFVASSAVVSSTVARLGIAAVPVLLPLTGVEPLGNLANLHWYLIYLMVWLVPFRAATRAGSIGMGAVALLCALSETQTLMVAPFLWWGLRTKRTDPWVAGGWALGMVAQIITYLTTLGSRPHDFGDIGSGVLGYVVHTSGSQFVGSAGTLGLIIVNVGWWLPVLGTLVLLGLGAWIVKVGSPTQRLIALLLVVGSVASWSASYFLNDHGKFQYADLTNSELINGFPLLRWGTGASMLLVAMVPLAAGVLMEGRGRLSWNTTVRRRLGTAVVVMMMLIMLVGFRHENSSRGGPSWNDELVKAELACQTQAQAIVVSSPFGWTVVVPCEAVT